MSTNTKEIRAELWRYFSGSPFADAAEAAEIVGTSLSTTYRIRREVLAHMGHTKKYVLTRGRKLKGYDKRKLTAKGSVAPTEEYRAPEEEGIPIQLALPLTLPAPPAPTPVAVDVVLDARALTYGRFVDVAETTQVLMGAIANRLAERGTIVQHDQALALQMIVQKLARIANGDPDHLDSWLDIAGYATLVAERLSGKAPR
jgi:hypothetical protein